VVAGAYAAGLSTAGLNVDADNLTGAIRLYRKAGMQRSQSATEWSKTLS
jgi:ribosomal protein S18 acetylase RimI-like enzyme